MEVEVEVVVVVPTQTQTLEEEAPPLLLQKEETLQNQATSKRV